MADLTEIFPRKLLRKSRNICTNATAVTVPHFLQTRQTQTSDSDISVAG